MHLFYAGTISTLRLFSCKEIVLLILSQFEIGHSQLELGLSPGMNPVIVFFSCHSIAINRIPPHSWFVKGALSNDMGLFLYMQGLGCSEVYGRV